jgi:N-acetylglucosamine-6-phosphate deacetylase
MQSSNSREVGGMIALLARELLTPVEAISHGVMLIEDGIIAAVGSRDSVVVPSTATVVDFGDTMLAPGLIDLHIHGAAGHDVMGGGDGSLAAIECFIARHGVTSYCPTTVSAPLDRTLSSLEWLGHAIEQQGNGSHCGSPRARPVGIHLEGPFLSHVRRGVHPPNLLQQPSLGLFEKLCRASGDKITMLTIAPELDGALEVIREASRRGLTVSLGHSDAGTEQTRRAIAVGATHATHTFNAMRPFDHRHPGLLGTVLTDSSMTADIIADGIHVDPIAVDLFVRCKGPERSVLITDGMSATGMPDGKYLLGSLEVEVRDGRCEANGRLAGSLLTLDQAVRNIMGFARLSFQESVRLATLNPATVLGIENRKGQLKPGADADIAVFSASGEVMRTIVAGVVN